MFICAPRFAQFLEADHLKFAVVENHCFTGWTRQYELLQFLAPYECPAIVGEWLERFHAFFKAFRLAAAFQKEVSDVVCLCETQHLARVSGV